MASKARLQLPQSRQEILGQCAGRRDMHRGREGIVRGLAEIDMIVGMDRRHPAPRRSKAFVGAIGDHLVDVHVRLGARTGLPDFQGKMIVKPPGDDLVGRRDDRRRSFVFETTRAPH